MHVYVAAPYMDAPLVRALHQQLTSARFTPTSSWADEATGAEALDALSPAEVRRIAKANDVRDVVWELVGGSSEKEGAHAA